MLLSCLQEESLTSLTRRLKEAEEERARLTRSASTQQQNIDKYRKLADDARGKAESLEAQLAGVKKVRAYCGEIDTRSELYICIALSTYIFVYMCVLLH